MTRALVFPLLAAVCLGAGCRSTPTPCPPGDAAARCAGARPGETVILPGVDSEYFTATTRQTLVLRSGLSFEPVRDAEGRPSGITIMALDNSPGVTVRCQCPDGCGSAPPGTEPGELYLGCLATVPEPGGSEPSVHCGGDCYQENTCCAGCGWVEVPG